MAYSDLNINDNWVSVHQSADIWASDDLSRHAGTEAVMAKVSAVGESFWVELLEPLEDGIYLARCRNNLIMYDVHWDDELFVPVSSIHFISTEGSFG